jgi:hypothetical protein
MVPTPIRSKPKQPSCIGGSEVTPEVTEGRMRKEVSMKPENQGREKRNLYILSTILLTLVHVVLTLGHTWDSLAAEHGRPLVATV